MVSSCWGILHEVLLILLQHKLPLAARIAASKSSSERTEKDIQTTLNVLRRLPQIKSKFSMETMRELAKRLWYIKYGSLSITNPL